MRLEGKSAVITGGASGIGASTARLFLREGAKVAIADYSDKGQDFVQQLKSEGYEALFVKTDVSREDDVRKAVETAVEAYGRLDIMFANAGIGDTTPAHELPLDQWQRMIDINLTGVFLSCKHAIAQMLKQQTGGAIVNTASILGHVGQAGITSYTAAKGGVVNLTRTLGVTYAKQGIRVNAVCPGYIMTPLLQDLDEQLMKALVDAHPIGRLGESEEVARAVLFLVSDDASFVTGTSLLVDGGYTAQ